MFCHITKDALNVMKIVIINALSKLQLLPFCFVGQYGVPNNLLGENLMWMCVPWM